MPREGCRAEAQRRQAATLEFDVSPPLISHVHDVYILQSVEEPERFYVGVTSDLRARLKRHNSGEVPHTSKYAPWHIKTYVAFSDESQAFAFERYLKSASGRAFAKKRL